MRHALTALALLPLALAAPAGAAPEPGLTSFTLDNGLTGVVIEDRRAPVVTHMVWYRVGSADDPAGQSGIAHFLEHLMFKATGTLADGEFSRIVSDNGGTDNAFTSTDYTGYFQRIAADRLDLVMGMEADRMVNLAPTEAGVLSERDVVLEERRQVVESAPSGPYNEQRRAALYLNHPYGRPVIGWEHEIETFTREKALAFYRDHYAPNNAILGVAGDVDAAEVERLAEKHFGPIPASPAISPRLRPQEPPHRAARRIEMRDARVREPSVSRAYLAPQRRSGDQADAAALYVLAELLGGSAATSVMARDLVMGRGLALDAGAFYSDTGVDAQTFGLYVSPKPGVSLADAEAALDALIARFVAEGPDPAQLARIKGRIRASEIYALDDQSRRARRIGTALTSGLTLQDVADWPDLLDAVTVEDVQAAARAVFRAENSVTGWLMGPDADARGLVQ
ncbi:MAG: insulinase family protein [Rhodobacteraceae bacterium]|nr:insulinase family protein [Paracoccaceae bacterium]